MSETGTFFAIKRLEIHDGPGVRTTVFLKGCPLRCLWCHNPEGLTAAPVLAHYRHKCVSCGACVAACPNGAHQIGQDGTHLFVRENCNACGACVPVCPARANHIFGEPTTPEQLLPELLLDKPFFDETGGGVTISGGEPLIQIDFLCELLALLKKNGVSTAIDTSLAVPRESVERAAQLADMFLCDIKAIDSATHERLTGQKPDRILSNMLYLDSIGVPMEIRVPYIPGCNDGEIPEIAHFVSRLHGVSKIKALAYHDLARTKYEATGRKYLLPEVKRPTEEELKSAQSILQAALAKPIPEAVSHGNEKKK